MASTMDGYQINTGWFEATNYNTMVYDTIDVDGSENLYRLTDHGVGKIVLTRLDYNTSNEYPQIQTPYETGDYLVFLESNSNYPVNCKESPYWNTFVYMGIFNSSQNICLMPSSDFYIIHIKISD